MITLYQFEISPFCDKVRRVLHWKKVPYEIVEVPLKLRPYALSLVWHPRVDGDEAHRFLRDVFLRAARQVAGERHEAPRTRLDVTDPTSGQARKRRRRRS